MDRWPSVTIEQRPWRTNPHQVGPNRRERALASIDVQIPAEIAEKQLRLTSTTTALVEQASAEVARLEARSSQLAGLGDLLIRSEAVATSKIEHVYADLDEIARASIGATAADSAGRTVAAARALRALTASADHGAPLRIEAITEAHRHLMLTDVVEGAWAGRFRRQQTWIGGSDLTPLGAAHIPPPWHDVERLMTDLVGFANRRDLSAVAQAAIAHAQFEAIHPFTDGNGRVGRALIGAVLRRHGVTRTVTVPAAAAMLADVDAYFDHLAGYRAGDADQMVAYLARAAIVASNSAEQSADVLAALPERWLDVTRPRRGSSTHSLILGLLGTPILNAERARAITGTTAIRTYEALDRLTEAGVLHELTQSARNRIWVVSDVMTELRELEERIGVRSTPSKRWR